MTLTVDNQSVVDRLEADIEVLKLARQRVIALRELLSRYSADLSYEFASPAAKVDQRLAALLLARELRPDS